jgi:rubrerythrin
VQSFFEFMSEEEERHVEILTGQFKAYQEKGSFEPGSFDSNESSRAASEILDKGIKEKISAAGFEAAAIGAAISMEERAIRVYSSRAETATDPEEKSLYEWLTKWEQQHLKMLSDIDKSVTEKVWFDNQFWPF